MQTSDNGMCRYAQGSNNGVVIDCIDGPNYSTLPISMFACLFVFCCFAVLIWNCVVYSPVPWIWAGFVALLWLTECFTSNGVPVSKLNSNTLRVSAIFLVLYDHRENRPYWTRWKMNHMETTRHTTLSAIWDHPQTSQTTDKKASPRQTRKTKTKKTPHWAQPKTPTLRHGS